MPTLVNGQTHYTPGSYGSLVVNVEGPAIQNEFNVPVLIGSARSGIPYHAGSGANVILPFNSMVKARNYFGDGELITAGNSFKKGGGGVGYFLNAANLTRAKATIQDNETTPANTLDINPKKYGATENDISISIAKIDTNVTVTIIPPKNHKFLTADVNSGSKEFGLETVDDIYVGDDIIIRDNVAAVLKTKIKSVDSANKKVVIEDALTEDLTVSNYARLFKEDVKNQEVYTVSETVTVNELIAELNVGEILDFSRESYSGKIPTDLTKSYIQDITGATLGTSPIASELANGDFDKVAQEFPRLAEEFRNATSRMIRLVCLVSGDALVHAVFNGLCKTMRANQCAIEVVSGCKLGDCKLEKTNSSHPALRGKALNTGDVVLAGHSLDDLDAYLSLGPQFVGMQSINSHRKNFSKVSIVANKVEEFLGEYNINVTDDYIKAGVLVVTSGQDGFKIAQAVNTYQNNLTTWNEADDDTYLIANRQTADYVFLSFKNQMALLVGKENVTITAARKVAYEILDKHKTAGDITNFEIRELRKEQNGYFLIPAIAIEDPNDFIGFEMHIDAKQ